TALAVGGYEEVTDLVDRTSRDPHFGWVVAGACTPNGLGPDGSASIHGVSVVGDLDDVATLAGSGFYRVIAVAPTPGWGSARLHRLSWALENTAVELAVHPGLMEIAGPRLHIAPVDGMPLLRLTEPRFTGFPRLLKNVVDRAAAVLLVILLCPFLLVIALAIRLDGGPVLYFQDRVGAGGRTFRMVKFRSMVVGADSRLEDLASTNDGCGPLFKMRRDPRVTRVGALLRRYSLDELPQVFNVLTGSMSLVGPRPPLPSEVDTYGVDAQRRLLVRPGITGLWQVSGRSDLSWEESVRLDLRYVENWSLALDASILWKTIGAVLGGRGAY
ncbi:MAG: sugar transferase, partial [Pseudonocardia sp.]|nr:sugar transferase [Pseudonocardia sp.]